jgi:hypothetical protein
MSVLAVRTYVVKPENGEESAMFSILSSSGPSGSKVRRGLNGFFRSFPIGTKELLAGKEADKPAQTEVAPIPGDSYEDKRLRIVNLYLEGKINDSQLERLLALIDSSVARANLV